MKYASGATTGSPYPTSTRRAADFNCRFRRSETRAGTNRKSLPPSRPALSMAARATPMFTSAKSGIRYGRKSAFCTSPNARATRRRPSAPWSRMSPLNVRSVFAARSISVALPQSASAAAATIASAGSACVRKGRMTSATASPRNVASAPTAATRTSVSGSVSARSTPGNHRSAMSGPADSATRSARARTWPDVCHNNSGDTSARLSIASSRSMAYNTRRGSGCASSLTRVSTVRGSGFVNFTSDGNTFCCSRLLRNVRTYSLRARMVVITHNPTIVKLA